jgi:lysozyme
MPRQAEWRGLRLFVAFATAMLLAACSSLEPSLPEPEDFPIHGIDVSKYQGDIDWPAVAAGGVRFVYLKATEGGDHADEKFQTNWVGSRAAGLPTGAYHFYYFCRPVEDQIAWFKATVPVTPDALPPVLDMEWNGHSPTCTKKPPAAEVLANMHKFLDAIEAHYGKRPVIYTTVDFHREVLVGHFPGHKFWLRSVAGHPSTKYTDREWHFWQYTATGKVQGVAGEVDRNAFFGTEAQWRDFVES